MSSAPIPLEYPFSINLDFILKIFYAVASLSAAVRAGGYEEFVASASYWWNVFSIVSFVLSALLLIGIIYSKLRLSELRHILHEQVHHEEEKYLREHEVSEHSRWNDVLVHIQSDAPNDWRLAIIEADIVLEEALGERGYIGTTIGDRLKTLPQTFRSLNDAWEAHKVRNDIAHRGGDFILTKRLAEGTIQRYQRVFEELDVL